MLFLYNVPHIHFDMFAHIANVRVEKKNEIEFDIELTS